ncbi:hypothetical protein M3661_07110 [Paenibacillus sp. MER 180]|uniref:hypothetical protein n=1 Tax=Paenibacillus sp. MER 180 TaxID=2939570 RepID=UPI002040B0A9|nr:hypothetical protein [Paenibacillus sp. MER 180]MCM3289897.1 hypothetical protein [Paenibacillus sp. MER 180]
MIFDNPAIKRSPVAQSFIWVAEYYDNTHLSEYNFDNKRANSFYHINKNKLIRFGLIGEGSQIYFDVGNGVFTLNEHRLSLSYVTSNQEYPLTGRTFLYNDIITYKNAVSDAKLFYAGSHDGRFSSTITQFNVGYKKKMQLHNANIDYQCILSIPYEEAAFFQIKITSDIDLDGKLVIRRNGRVADEIAAPLKAKHAGMMNWTIK